MAARWPAAQLRAILDHVPVRRRAQGLIVLLGMLVGAGAELLTIGAVLPFLAIIADPRASAAHPLLVPLLAVPERLGVAPLTGFAILFCVIAIFAALVRITLAWGSQRYVYKLGYDIGVAVYRRVLHRPYEYHVARNSSEVLAGIGKVQLVVSGMLMPVMLALTSMVIATFIFVGLLLIDPQVALVSGVGFGLIYVGVSVATRRRLTSNSRVIAASQTERVKVVQEGIGGIRDVLLDHSQDIYVRKFAAIDSRLRDAQAANALIAASPRFVIEGAGMILIVLLALLLQSERGGLAGALPILGALALGAQRMLPLLQLMYNGWTSVMSSSGTFSDVLDLLGPPGTPVAAPRERPLPFRRELGLDAVTFRYGPEGPAVLDRLSLAIPRGTRIGLVGMTGAGKSTVMDLVMGLLTPTSGTIRIDGKAVTPANVARWQAQVAHVPQHIYLADTTILENIAFGVPAAQIDGARALEAATRAGIAGFIAGLPQGYRTPVGERGVRLSGGQRQRIGIARALYKRSALLVLDEATSALDDMTEAAVTSAIDRLGGDVTVLIIAHRTTTLRGCDRIYELGGGRIVRSGSYADLYGDVHAPLAGVGS